MSIRRIFSIMTVALVSIIGGSSDVSAQDVTEEAATEAAVQSLRQLAAAPSPGAADRIVIREFLERDDVRAAADGRGIDLTRVAQAAATIDDEAAADMADRIRDLEEEALAGGDTLVISASTVVIVLLVLILVAVA
jgi:CO dehydrogenase/acetyl-CoA synthase alpha subunit